MMELNKSLYPLGMCRLLFISFLLGVNVSAFSPSLMNVAMNGKKKNNNNKRVMSISPLFSTTEESVPSDVEEDDTSSSSSFVGGSVSSEVGMGKWEEQDGNYILRPPDGMTPRALIHFLGGAIVGTSPDLTYRYLLERLAERGYLIVATSYNTSFDYLRICDQVISSFERVAPSLARQYGAVPVIGVGHSCGALLHLLITCLFPDTPRAANVLISYLNRSVPDAVPFLDEFFAPLFLAASTDPIDTQNENNNNNIPLLNPFPKKGTDIIRLLLKLGRTSAKGTTFIFQYTHSCFSFVFCHSFLPCKIILYTMSSLFNHI